MYKINIVSPENFLSFDLGCLYEVFSLPQVVDSGIELQASKDSELPLNLDQSSIVIFCGWDQKVNLSRIVINKIEEFLYQKGNIVVVGESVINILRQHINIDLFSAKKQILLLNSGLSVLEWAIEYVAEKKGLHIAQDMAERLSLCPNKVSLILKKNTSDLSKCSMRLKKVLVWAEANLTDIHSIDMLADRAFMSRRNFDRQFRAVYQQSPKEWLTQKRLSLAKTYLEDTELCIEEIAGVAGFANAINFRNNFRSCIGISPSTYRSNFAGVA
ncbi:helix-turn-helix domain-containing protein [Pseudoalteromonas denitrificans]|uniref:Helix-turn-helix domain-containing protein n=1 Tax=Pseudoalteromonas denitrificans DSM 6059 TaxID=1123010 RepID=A0A1I1JK11_9GAMM|nr:helix-turn-helix domain-containing protein [Pseudoalteromonas denitrificans]SFC48826.1 Helix-turn-helix domain-containing protein [Pseudoalteromonas denitrificans DSM 6059]